MRDLKTAGAKRLRHWIVFGGLVVMLAVAAVFAKSGCGRGEPIFAGGDAWATYLVSLFFVLLGWGPLGSDALGHLFLRLGWEPDFRPVRITTGEGSDLELTRGAKKWPRAPRPPRKAHWLRRRSSVRCGRQCVNRLRRFTPLGVQRRLRCYRKTGQLPAVLPRCYPEYFRPAQNFSKLLKSLAHPTGFEPVTSAFGATSANLR
jgi:hypothetical protein